MKTNDAAVAAIRFALDGENISEATTFLNLWFHGEFDAIRREWDGVPDEVFIGADPMFPAPPAQEGVSFARSLVGPCPVCKAPPFQKNPWKDLIEFECGAHNIPFNENSPDDTLMRLFNAYQAMSGECAPTPEPDPVLWTERQIELIDGMIEAQKYHSERMSQIGNRLMGDKQIKWNAERIEILEKAKALNKLK